MKLDGSTILVTGASSGIGAALAPQLAAKGATVGIVARRAERLESVVTECRKHTPASTSWAADLSDVDRAVAVALEAWDHFGGLDALVNNAAIGKRKLRADADARRSRRRPCRRTSSPRSAWEWRCSPAGSSAETALS